MWGVEENMFYANTTVGKGYRAHYCRMEDCEYTFQVQTDFEATSWPIILARSLMNAIIVKVSANLETAERSLDKKPTWQPLKGRSLGQKDSIFRVEGCHTKTGTTQFKACKLENGKKIGSRSFEEQRY